MEDLDVEHERDGEDYVVQDDGFAARTSWAMAQKKAKHIKKQRKTKPSDEVANGDRMEDLDLENVRDVNDDIVDDTGFASRSSWAQKKAKHFKKSRNPSDEVANGDKMEDLDLEDERDVNDDIVQDNGFAARSSWAQKKAKHFKKHRKHHGRSLVQTQYAFNNPSDEVANGDRMEDLDLEDERDGDDSIVQDYGFASRMSWAVQLGYNFEKPSDEVANGDEKEDLEVLDERDVNDDVVQDVGFAARSSWIQTGDDVKAPAKDGKKKGPVKYSDEIANGDHFDDKELEDVRDT